MISTNINAQELTENKKNTLKIVYSYGQLIEFNNKEMGEELASICFQESKGNSKIFQTNGKIVGDSNKSFGPMQVQLRSARDVARWNPAIFEKKFNSTSPTNNQLKKALLEDLHFNIAVGAAYFKKMLDLKKDLHEAIIAYNKGPNSKKKTKVYLVKVLNNKEMLASLFEPEPQKVEKTLDNEKGFWYTVKEWFS